MTTALPLTEAFAAWFNNAPELIDDPYPFFHRLRREAPIYPQGDLIVMSRYAECYAAALQHALWKTDGKSYDYGSLDRNTLPAEQQGLLSELFQMERLALNKTEGEQHDRIRGLLQRAFTPKTIEGLAAPLQKITDDLLDEIGNKSEIDAIDEFAFQLPLIMICTLLEVPVADRRRLRDWSLGISGLFGGARDDLIRVINEAYVNRKALFAYLREIIDRRRITGGDPDSVMSILLAAEGDDRLSSEELVANAALFVFAGHETTTNAIGNGIVAFMQNRDQWELLCKSPSLARNAADEALRYISPVQTEPRYAIRDAKVGDVSVPAGQRVRLLWAAANRDPEKFPEPDRFDITRNGVKHLAFGIGRHHCLGSALARLEISTAFTALAQRFPRMQMIESKPRWRPTFNIRCVTELPLRLSGG
jgi:cytochrome P450